MKNMSLEILEKALKHSWSKETCYEAQQNQWSPQNPAYGQCFVSALIVNDYMGGEFIKVKTTSGVSHYYNCINGEEVDLTRSQFSDNEVFLGKSFLKRRDLPENNRYLLLKKKVQDNILL